MMQIDTLAVVLILALSIAFAMFVATGVMIISDTKDAFRSTKPKRLLYDPIEIAMMTGSAAMIVVMVTLILLLVLATKSLMPM